MSVNYEVDYNDPRLKSARDGEADELKESDNLYDTMASDTKEQYDKLIDAADKNAETQTKLQQEQTDFTIKQIEQQKEQLEKDYQKEQAAAYTDYQKQIDPYGVNAEQMAAQGMSGSGYSESSKVRMYNAYQNRVAVARDVAERAKVEYDNAMTEARLQNSSILAEIAATAYETKLKLSLESFQQQNSLILQKVSARNAIEAKYDDKWLTTLDTIIAELELEEKARQFDESLKEEQRQFGILHPQDEGSGGDGNLSIETNAKRTASVNIFDALGDTMTKISGTGDSSKSKNDGSGSETKSNSASKDVVLQPDVESVDALGYGSISPLRLDELIRSGEVEEYVEDGKLKYRRTKAKKSTSPIKSGKVYGL